MITMTTIVRSLTDDPWKNLSAEEYMLDRVGEEEMILFVWQNAHTVVIGKNQNAWKECGTEAMEKDGVRLARRISGGGAVFHDLGNLNFTFLTRKENYDLPRQAGVILEAARSAGVEAVMSGRNDITADGRKFSGNAFCFRRKGAFHHGTILVDTDLAALSGYLRASPEKITSKGVESVRSRVTNLIEHSPGLTIAKMKKCLETAFENEYGKAAAVIEGFMGMDQAELQKLYEKYSSWEWRFGETPGFDVELETRFPWGGVQILLTLEKARIKSAKVYTDSIDENLAGTLAKALDGAQFASPAMADRIRNASGGDANSGFDGGGTDSYSDLAKWILEKGF